MGMFSESEAFCAQCMQQVWEVVLEIDGSLSVGCLALGGATVTGCAGMMCDVCVVSIAGRL